MFRRWLLPWLVYWVYRLWTWSWRTQLVVHPSVQKLLEQNESMIFAHWHGHELAIVQLVSQFRIATMTSTSKDGALVDFVVRKLGGATSRGSSTRGGVQALKGLIRLLQSRKHNASMAVDGPKGPIYKVKPGIFELSRLAKAPIVPVSAAASAKKLFQRSWNKALLPLPFSRVVVVFGPVIPAIGRGTDPKDPQLAADLEAKLLGTTQQALNTI